MSKEQFPSFTDLRAIASDIEGKPEYRRLQSLISKAATTQSCVSDLMQASTCCDALDEVLPSPRKVGTLNRAATEAALLQTAVLLYERATAAAGKRGERGSISIAQELTSEQLADHKAIVQLRQRAVAHVYVGEDIEGTVWHRNILFAVEFNGTWQTAVAANRVQFDRVTFGRLKRQIPVATKLMTARFHQHLARLTNLLNAYPVSHDLFRRHEFDPVAVFGSNRAVRELLASQGSGKASLLSH
jgi:hypothetical protein